MAELKERSQKINDKLLVKDSDDKPSAQRKIRGLDRGRGLIH